MPIKEGQICSTVELVSKQPIGQQNHNTKQELKRTCKQQKIMEFS